MTLVRSLVAVSLLTALSACTVWPVGEDPYSMNTRRDANRVLEAIQTFHQSQNAYPPSLAALVPAYLPALPEGPALQYNPYDGSISYHYIPSWPQLHWTYCSSVGDTTEWRCSEKML